MRSTLIVRHIATVACVTMLGACSAVDRIADIGREPSFDPIINPTQMPNYAPVSMPMPAPALRSHLAEVRAMHCTDLDNGLDPDGPLHALTGVHSVQHRLGATTGTFLVSSHCHWQSPKHLEESRGSM